MGEVALIDEKLRELRERLSAINAQRRDIQSMIAAIEKVRRVITGEPSSVAFRSVPRLAARGANVTQVVLDALRSHPNGILRMKLVNDLESQIVTNSPDRRKLLQNTILNMERRGYLRVDRSCGSQVVFPLLSPSKESP